MSLGLDPIRDVRGVPIERYRAGLGEYLDAVASDAWSNGPMAGVDRLLGVASENVGAIQRGERLLSPEDASERGRELGLRFERPISESAWNIVADAKRHQLASETVYQRARQENGYGTLDWLLGGGTEFLASAADPLNIASAFVPVVGEARYALWAARIGRLPAALAKGAAEGAVGQALLEPITAADRQLLGDEYSMLDTLMNLGFGGGLGVALHGAAYGAGAGFRFIRDRYTISERAAPTLTEPRMAADAVAPEGRPVLEATRVEESPPRQPVAEAMETLRPETKDAAMRTAVAQLAQDKPVDIEPVLRADPSWSDVRRTIREAQADIVALQRESANGNQPTVAPPEGWQPSPEDLKLATRVARGWTPDVPLDRPQSLVDFVRKNGGLNRESAEAGELLASDLGKQPGLLRRPGVGRQADHMAQAAAEAGYRLGAETATGSGVNVDAFVKALIEDASGRTKHFPDDGHTTAWQVQQRYFAEFKSYLADTLGLDPKGMEPRQLAWLLQQDPHTARTLVLLHQIDTLGPDASLELASRLDAERAAIEREILSEEPGAVEPDAPKADHREIPAATLDELERYYADLERAAGEGEAGGRPAERPVAAGRPAEGGQAPDAGPGRDTAAPEGAGLRRAPGQEGPAGPERTAADLDEPPTPDELGRFAERQQAADLHADPAALELRDERLAGEAREVQQLLADDLKDHGHLLDDTTRTIFDETTRIFDDEAKAIDALAACRIGGGE